MRNGQNNKHRMRGRNRSKNHNPLTRVYESNGPDVKIRGTANHVAEKYIQLARDATTSGDPVAAENYYQHAEHYFRMIAAANEQFRQSTPFNQRPDGGGQSSDDDGDDDDGQPNYGSVEPHSPREQQQQGNYQQPRESQPYQPREQREHQPREHSYQPREQREQSYQPRDHQQRDNQQSNYRPRFENAPQPQPAPVAEAADVGGLPSFITGTPPQAVAAPQNGHENQGDRFPLHRRRRRGHRGPRPEGSGSEGNDDGPQGLPPANE